VKLVSLETAGVRGLADGAWALGEGHDEPRPLVLLTGPNGVGLTTWLEAVAATAGRLSTAGPVPESDRLVDVRGSTATIRSSWLLDEAERRYGGLDEEVTSAEVRLQRGAMPTAEADPALLGLMSRYDHQPTLSKLVYVSAYRTAEPSFSPIQDFESEQRRTRLALDGDKYGSSARAVCRLHREGDRGMFDRIATLFARLSETTRLVGVAANGQPELALVGGGRIALGRAGFAERNAFTLAAMPILCGLERSVILLDTPELGLAPGLALRWVEALREVTPDAQWIVATRDAELLASVEPAARVHLSRRP
jgi:hypothetical protein